MPDIEPLTPNRSISARIAEKILANIVSGEFAVGDKLPPETELAKAFGVSRPSLREALGALQFVGYIESTRGSGNKVVRSTRPPLGVPARSYDPTATVLDLFEARLRVEPEVAAAAALNPDLERLADVDDLIKGMRLAVKEPNLHAETDLFVHRGIAMVCQNHFLRDLATSLIEIAGSDDFGQIREALGPWGDQSLPSIWLSQLEMVTKAIHQRDANAAALASWEHMASAATNALDILAADQSASKHADRLAALIDRGRQPAGPNPD